MSYYSPSERQRRSNSALSPCRKCEIVKVMFILSLSMQLLCRGQLGTCRGDALVCAQSWHVRLQEAELLWRPALLQGTNPPCVSQWWSCLCRIPELCSLITANLFPCEKYLCTLYSLFTLLRPQSFLGNARDTFPVPISALAIRCAANLPISVAPQD